MTETPPPRILLVRDRRRVDTLLALHHRIEVEGRFIAYSQRFLIETRKLSE